MARAWRFAACAAGLALAWPSPSGPLGRQWLRAQGWVLKILSAQRLERIFGCPCGWRGRPGQCAAFRPRACDFPSVGANCATLTAWSSRTGAATADTAGTARGRSPGPPGAAARRAAGLPPGGRDESCRTAYGVSPDLSPAVYGGPLWPLIPPGCPRPSSRGSGPSRQARRAEGAPLMS